MRSPLPKKQIEWSEYFLQRPDKIAVIERVLYFDPTELYERLGDKLITSKRHAGISMDLLFPKIPGKCACGCDKKPEMYANDTNNRKFASHNCQAFASDVLSIINNYFGKPAFYISIYSGKKCSECDETDHLELDHIIGVKHGGGGCWLSNYRWLCKKCHVNKTNKDFKRKEFKVEAETNQQKLF